MKEGKRREEKEPCNEVGSLTLPPLDSFPRSVFSHANSRGARAAVTKRE